MGLADGWGMRKPAHIVEVEKEQDRACNGG